MCSLSKYLSNEPKQCTLTFSKTILFITNYHLLQMRSRLYMIFEKTGCKFSWRNGEVCKSKHDDLNKSKTKKKSGQTNIDGRVWPIQIHTGKHCGQKPTRKNAFDLDVPKGTYLITLASSTGGFLISKEKIPPSIGIRVVEKNENTHRGLDVNTIIQDATIDDIGHGIVVTTTTALSTIWLWHKPIVPDDSKSECSNNRGKIQSDAVSKCCDK